ncbi:MAG: metal ABC transporter ATP-binding protein [Candidatus Yonathbacteria bacterium]|nr:metal ABC transporter ATP-binding protein [Candidatus Yonathbacteria bacterium]
MDSVISVRNLSFHYGGTSVLSDVSFEIPAGAYVALAGPNGAGKTTLLKLILGLVSGYTGTIDLLGTERAHFSRWRLIGYMPQRAGAFNPLFPATVREIVRAGLLAGKKFPKRFTHEDDVAVTKALALMRAEHLADTPIQELSGGQEQRVFLARALVTRPKLLILDEPSTALDPETHEHLLSLLHTLNKEHGITVIVVTHDTSRIGEYADTLLYLDKRVIFFGPFADSCDAEPMRSYFGQSSGHIFNHPPHDDAGHHHDHR